MAEEIGGLSVPGDVSDPGQVHALVAEVARQVGDVDVLVANHAYMTMAPFLEHDVDDWWKVVDTNLGGTFHLVQAVLPGMRRRGAGRIVVISSEWGVTGWPGATAYAASKAGLISLTKTLGRELAPEGIIVNAVAPGVTDTPQLEVDARDAGRRPGRDARPVRRGHPAGADRDGGGDGRGGGAAGRLPAGGHGRSGGAGQRRQHAQPRLRRRARGTSDAVSDVT